MIDFIEKEFSYLLEKDYHGKVEEITYVFKNIIYYKPNIKIVVSC